MMQAETWRVGGKQPRNIYVNDEPTAVALGAKEAAEETARRIVQAMTGLDEMLHLALVLQEQCEPGCGEMGRCERCTRRSSIGERVGELVLAASPGGLSG